MPSITVEVCVGDGVGLAAAIKGGAQRIELCSALSVGGLTPSAGLMRLARASPVPVFPMLRPRAGSFVYDVDELDLIRRDIDAVAEAGLRGVVLGASKPSGELDASACEVLITQARGLGLAVTLHRAMDLTPDPVEAVDIAVALGAERVLTSGGARTAPEGVDTIAAMVARAAGRLSIMAGSGVSAANAAELVRRTGVREVHGSCSRPVVENDPRLIELGFSDPNRRGTVTDDVAALVAAVEGLEPEGFRSTRSEP
jgi:copper homeostasis protein